VAAHMHRPLSILFPWLRLVPVPAPISPCLASATHLLGPSLVAELDKEGTPLELHKIRQPGYATHPAPAAPAPEPASPFDYHHHSKARTPYVRAEVSGIASRSLESMFDAALSL
jgi:hypothetical protein